MGFFDKIKQGLTKTKTKMDAQLTGIFAAYAPGDEEFFEDLEETLILADTGVETTTKAIAQLRKAIELKKLTTGAEVKKEFVQILTRILKVQDTMLLLTTQPSVVLVVGVNGVGKTTTIGKLASQLKKEGNQLVLFTIDKDEFDLPKYDAEIITGHKKFADLFEAATELCGKPKKVSNWIMVETMRLLKENNMDPEDIRFSPVNLAKLINLADSGSITNTVAKEVFELIFKDDIDPEKYVEEKGLKTVNDEGALRETVQKILAENPQSVEDYHNGKEKAIGFLVGQTMKAMKGKANPGMVNQILKELL